jgi:hypothetical protein
MQWICRVRIRVPKDEPMTEIVVGTNATNTLSVREKIPNILFETLMLFRSVSLHSRSLDLSPMVPR